VPAENGGMGAMFALATTTAPGSMSICPPPKSVIVSCVLVTLRRVCELLSVPLFSKMILLGPAGAGAGLMFEAVLRDVLELKI